MSEQEQTSNTGASLSINDLKLCIQIIDVCSSRGAIKPDEFQAIGILHSKLSKFIEMSVQAAAAAATDSTNTPEENQND